MRLHQRALTDRLIGCVRESRVAVLQPPPFPFQ